MANLLTRVWQAIFPSNGTATGKNRNLVNLADGNSIYSRYLDLEIPEDIARETPDRRNRKMVEIVEFCPPALKGLRVLVDDCFAAVDSSDQIIHIADTLDDLKTPVDANIKTIGEDVLGRLDVNKLKLLTKRMLGYGDAFCEIVPYKDGPQHIVGSIQPLPTFQLFRVEDDHGELLGFEQRRGLYSDPDLIRFSPVQVVHFRYDQHNLYGRPLYWACVDDWDNYKLAHVSLAESLKTANNPMVYKLPDYYQQEQFDQFKADRIAEFQSGIVPLLFITSEMELNRLSNTNPELTGLIEPIAQFRRSIQEQSRLPAWYWTSEPQTGGAKDISGQPSLSHLRFIASIRQQINLGLRQIINTELVLRGYVDPKERRYRIQWPPLQSNTNEVYAENNRQEGGENGQGQSTQTQGQSQQATGQNSGQSASYAYNRHYH